MLEEPRSSEEQPDPAGAGRPEDPPGAGDPQASNPQSEDTQMLWMAAQETRSNEVAWMRLIERHRGRIMIYAARLLGPELRRILDPEDVVNEAWMRIACHADRFEHRGKSSLYHWLRLQVKRVVLDRQRNIQRKGGQGVLHADGPSSMGMPDEADDTRGPATLVGQRDQVEKITQALESVPDTYRKPLEACFLKGRSRKEVAEKLGITENTLAKRIERGMEKWRAALGGVDPVGLIGG